MKDTEGGHVATQVYARVKLEAVKLVRDRGVTVVLAARDLDLARKYKAESCESNGRNCEVLIRSMRQMWNSRQRWAVGVQGVMVLEICTIMTLVILKTIDLKKTAHSLISDSLGIISCLPR